MDTRPLSITRPLELELIDASGEATSVRADLTYDVTDPYAVAAGFTVTDSTVRWVFARTLLATGVYEPAGEGDVHVWPCLNEHGQAVTVIELCSPDGQALLQAPSSDVCAFLTETERLIATGAESAHVDIDEAIASLLR